MGQLVSDFVVERLKAWNVERIFSYPGDGINGLPGALHCAGNTPEFTEAILEMSIHDVLENVHP